MRSVINDPTSGDISAALTDGLSDVATASVRRAPFHSPLPNDASPETTILNVTTSAG